MRTEPRVEPGRSADELWRAHAPELVRFATMLVGPADANDVVSIAFLKARGALQAGGVDQARPYLFRVVANVAHDHLRGSRRRMARDLYAVLPELMGEQAVSVDVRRAVSRLSVRQRAVVYFTYWEDLPERDVAEILQITVGSVRRHLSRARDHLRKALQ